MNLFGKKAPETGVVGAFKHLDSLIAAVEKARQDKELEVKDVFSPVPIHAVQDILSPSKSPVRFVTLSGALFGVIGGFALSIVTSLIWNIYVGGKPITNHVPFVVVGFEALILFGALATFLAIIVFARLPYRQFPGPAYQPSFSNDEFGLWIAHADAEKARAFLEAAGAVGVTPIGHMEGGDE
jgi:molybdopterin-containing oxidoreductase family membrane subunit